MPLVEVRVLSSQSMKKNSTKVYTKVYKIRDKKTGLFSTGGMTPSWRKEGKIWSTIGFVRAHLTLHAQGTLGEGPYKDAELVPYLLEESVTEDVQDLLEEIQEIMKRVKALSSRGSHLA